MRKKTRNSPYVLKRQTNQEVLFEAAYVKHYYEGYCALFEKYPASHTNIRLCRNLGFKDESYKNDLCVLLRYWEGEEPTVIGYFVEICSAGSEAEATKRMQQNLEGAKLFRSLMEGT